MARIDPAPQPAHENATAFLHVPTCSKLHLDVLFQDPGLSPETYLGASIQTWSVVDSHEPRDQFVDHVRSFI
jgi:hypothetical protein